MIEEYISKLDSQKFGFLVARIPLFRDDFQKLISQLKDVGVKMIIVRLDASEISQINKLENFGFLVKDVQLEYKYNLDDNKKISLIDDQGFLLRDLDLKDIPQIKDITKKSFNNYGHYFADDRLDQEKCLEVYIDWSENCCTNKDFADKVIVAVLDNNIAGYLAFKNFVEEHYTFACLGAVNPKFRKLGVFNALNSYGLIWAKSIGLKSVTTNVLNTNYPVNGTYIDLGFKIIKSYITMHYWCD
jgi:ribosomal protein S18 acetylase RimI-like enzyme